MYQIQFNQPKVIHYYFLALITAMNLEPQSEVQVTRQQIPGKLQTNINPIQLDCFVLLYHKDILTARVRVINAAKIV